MEDKVKNQISEHVTTNPIFLYMKGTPEAPACGFSHEVILALKQCQANFKSFNVLEDWDVREGIKEFASWPFIPQLYIKGQFIGGRDIVMDLHRKGELKAAIDAAQSK